MLLPPLLAIEFVLFRRTSVIEEAFTFIEKSSPATLLAFGTLFALPLAGILFYYLRERPERSDESFSSINARLRNLASELLEIKAQGPGSADKGVQEKLVSDIQTAVETRILQNYEIQREDSYIIKTVEAIFLDTQERLRREISALIRRGNYNLFIGVLTTFLAVGGLIFMLYSAQPAVQSWM